MARVPESEPPLTLDAPGVSAFGHPGDHGPPPTESRPQMITIGPHKRLSQPDH